MVTLWSWYRCRGPVEVKLISNAMANEPSMMERGLLSEALIENVELADKLEFFGAVKAAEAMIIL